MNISVYLRHGSSGTKVKKWHVPKFAVFKCACLTFFQVTNNLEYVFPKNHFDYFRAINRFAMLRIFKTIRTLSSIFFIALLVISYSYLIEQSRAFINVEKTKSMEVEMLFYIGLGIFVFLSLLFFIFDKTLLSYQSKIQREHFFTSNSFLTWLVAFNISINLFLCSVILYIGLINSEFFFNLQTYWALLYIGPILIILSLLALPILYIRNKKA